MYIICAGLKKKIARQSVVNISIDYLRKKIKIFEMVTSNFDLVSTFFPSVVETTHETLKVLKYCV